MTDNELRFEFGENWQNFLSVLDDARIDAATKDIKQKLGVETLEGKSFLDVGSGSGLSSLVARKLGAKVISFDYDPNSVACTSELKRRYFDGDEDWQIMQGSALDEAFMQSLGTFDIVYSWGVLHHSGNMWKGLELVLGNMKEKASLFVSIYNHVPIRSRVWKEIKRAYVAAPDWLKKIMLYTYMGFSEAKIAVRCMLHLQNPLTRYERKRDGERGMSIYYDYIDWIGGYPYEYAYAHDIFDFYHSRGLSLEHLFVSSGTGCNIFVFKR